MAYTPNDSVGRDWTLTAAAALVAGCRDLSVSDSKGQVDISDRDTITKKFALGMQDFTITGTILAGAAGAQTLQTAYDGNNAVAFVLSPATSGTGAAQKYSFSGVVTKMDLSLSMEGAAEYSFEIRPQGAITLGAAS